MAFSGLTFPNLKLIHGLKKSVILPTVIVSNGNSEFRINRMAFDKYSWSYQARSLINSDKLSLYAFYKSVSGSLNSFKYQDPDFPNFTGQTLTNQATTKWLFNFPGSIDHPLYNYDASMVIKKNGSIAAWTFSIVASKPIITIAGSIPSDTITVESGACYLAARFDGNINWQIEALNTDNTTAVVNFDQVNLVEVFEHA